MTRRIEMLVEERDGKTVLTCPLVGLFTQAFDKGALLYPGFEAGIVHQLQIAFDLVVPKGVHGTIANERPELVNEPVDYGTVLYELAPLDAAAATDTAVAATDEASGLPTYRAPYSGRFWHRPTPGDPPFVSAGDELVAGQTIGLIEVMKTFTHLNYEAADGLPERAKVLRLVVEDGAEVREGDALIELEG